MIRRYHVADPQLRGHASHPGEIARCEMVYWIHYTGLNPLFALGVLCSVDSMLVRIARIESTTIKFPFSPIQASYK
jgi:hypothetical protein